MRSAAPPGQPLKPSPSDPAAAGHRAATAGRPGGSGAGDTACEGRLALRAHPTARHARRMTDIEPHELTAKLERIATYDSSMT
jgi:hypothetical protein